MSTFRATVYDKAFTRKGWVGAYQSMSVTVRHNAVSSATFTVRDDHPRAGDLIAVGARVVIEYEGRQILSGPVETVEGNLAASTVTVTVVSDFIVLSQILAWVHPDRPGSEQGGETAYRTIRGPAEDVVKRVVKENADRLGVPVSIAPSLNRGATVTASFRFHPIADRIFPLVDTAGIGVTVQQVGAGLVVDCYEPATRSRLLSRSSGVVADWSWSRTRPGATRVVVGAGGEGVDRHFTGANDTPREALWGFKAEVFRDARDVEPADTPTLLERCLETLAETAATYGFSLRLSETQGFRYGRTFEVGDVVPFEVLPGVFESDVVREATLTDATGEGVTITPVVSDPDQTPELIFGRAIAALNRGLRDLRVR